MNDAVAFILARGGSKRIPRKNIRFFCGKPMLAWPVTAAISSGIFERVIMSTDDPEIAATAVSYGAEAPSLRPAELSDDFSTTADVLRHLLQNDRERSEYCCCLYGTSAFLTVEMLHEGFELLRRPNGECVMAVAEYTHPIERALRIDDDNFLRYRNPEHTSSRTQDLPASFYDLGLMYWIRVEAFFAAGARSFKDLAIRPLVIPKHRAVDIDMEEDWAFAEKMASLYQNGKKP